MLKKILIFLLVIIIAVLVVIYYYWGKVTSLPSWYKPQAGKATQQTIDKQKTAERSKEIILKKLPAPAKASGKNPAAKPVEVNLNAEEINDLLLASLLEKSRENNLDKAIRATHTEIKNGQIESGAIINLSDLSREQMGEKEQRTLDKAMSLFPFLKDQEVYIGVEGKPVLENNAVTIGSDSRIKIGDTEHDLNTLSEMLDINPKKIRNAVSLSLESVDLGEVTVDNNQIQIKGQQK